MASSWLPRTGISFSSGSRRLMRRGFGGSICQGRERDLTSIWGGVGGDSGAASLTNRISAAACKNCSPPSWYYRVYYLLLSGIASGLLPLRHYTPDLAQRGPLIAKADAHLRLRGGPKATSSITRRVEALQEAGERARVNKCRVESWRREARRGWGGNRRRRRVYASPLQRTLCFARVEYPQ